MRYDVLIIGGVAAGTSAGASAKRRDPSLDILLVQREKYISYGGCGLPYYVEGIVKTIDDLITFTPVQFREKRGVEVLTEHEVIDVDFEKKIAKVKDVKGEAIFEIEWRKLVISTGASVIVPKIEGVEDERVFTIRTPEDAMKIRKFLEERKPEVAVIIGGGYIGLEMAEAISAHGVRVKIVEMMKKLANSEPEMNDLIIEELKRNGVEVLLSTKVEKIVPGERLEIITDSGNLKADMVLIAVGVRPNTEIFDLEKGVKDAIRVDGSGRTSVEDVYAAGDCATVKHLVTQKEAYIPMGTTANKQGRVVGKVIGGGKDELAGVVGSAITKVFDLEFGRAGLTLEEAKREGFDAESVYIRAKSRAGYYPESVPVHLKLVFERKNGRVLGAQLVGKEIHKRLNVLSTAIHTGMDVLELSYLDLAYAPPFSPVWDPVLIAANVARRKL